MICALTLAHFGNIFFLIPGTVFLRGCPHPRFEQAAEMLGILEAQFVGDFADGFAGVEHFFLGQIYDFELNIFLSGFPGFLFDEVTEIIGGQVQLVGAVSNGRQAQRLRFVGLEISVQHRFKAFQNALVHIVTSDELAVVEPDAVIQKQLYIGNNQSLAVFVDGVLQLKFNFVQTIHHHLTFLFRKMQGFKGFVREKIVVFDVLPEGSATDEIGVEKQGSAFGLKGFTIIFNADDLPWTDEYQGSFLIIIKVPTISEIAAFDIFQEDGIDTHVHTDMPTLRSLGKVDHADQRVQGFLSHMVLY